MRKTKKIIWCEVTCGKCGRAALNCGYYTPDVIKRLKRETTNWVEDDTYRVLCPSCKEVIECQL